MIFFVFALIPFSVRDIFTNFRKYIGTLNGLVLLVCMSYKCMRSTIKLLDRVSEQKKKTTT